MKRKGRPSQFRHRKHIPYGSQGYCGYGGEFYSYKYRGEFLSDIINKPKERLKNKTAYIMKNEDLENKNLNDSAYKEDQESDPDLDD